MNAVRRGGREAHIPWLGHHDVSRRRLWGSENINEARESDLSWHKRLRDSAIRPITQLSLVYRPPVGARARHRSLHRLRHP